MLPCDLEKPLVNELHNKTQSLSTPFKEVSCKPLCLQLTSLGGVVPQARQGEGGKGSIIHAANSTSYPKRRPLLPPT